MSPCNAQDLVIDLAARLAQKRHSVFVGPLDGLVGGQMEGRMKKYKGSSRHTNVSQQPAQERTLADYLYHPCPDLTSSALCREPVPGGGRPRGDPPPERLCLVCHGLQGAHHGMSWGLWAPVLPAHPQQAAEIRLPVHRRLLVRGRGGKTPRVWLPPVFLRPSARLPPTSQTPASWGWDSHVGPPRDSR